MGSLQKPRKPRATFRMIGWRDFMVLNLLVFAERLDTAALVYPASPSEGQEAPVPEGDNEKLPYPIDYDPLSFYGDIPEPLNPYHPGFPQGFKGLQLTPVDPANYFKYSNQDSARKEASDEKGIVTGS